MPQLRPLDRIDQIEGLQSVPRPIVAAKTDYPAGEATRWHSHARGQLVYGISGVMAVRAASGEGASENGATGIWVVPPERAVWVPANVEHRTEFRTAVEMRSLFIRADAAAPLPDTCRVVTISPLMRELIQAACEIPVEYDADGPDGRVMDVLMDQLAVLDQTPLHLPLPEDPRITGMAETLAQDPADPRTLDDWARVAGASARTLARLFIKQTGMTFGAWRQQARLLKALEMLAQGQSVTATALDLGYDSPSAFIAMFRKALGVSPGKYFGN